MTTWHDFSSAAPETAAVFLRRLEADGLGLLATIRSDGWPRISPVEPAVHDGQLMLGMMGGSTKSHDLRRDPRCCLHSATEDKDVKDGDAKLFGRAVEVTDPGERRAFATRLQEDTGFDPEQGTGFDLYRLDITGGSALELGDDGKHLRITAWQQGGEERVIKRY